MWAPGPEVWECFDLPYFDQVMWGHVEMMFQLLALVLLKRKT